MPHARSTLVSHLSLLLLLLRFAPLASASVFSCLGGSVYVVAHPDDDLLFQAPDLQTDVSGNNCITVVFLTAGDSGTNSGYAKSREAGSAAAYAQMAGTPNAYTAVTAILGGQPVVVETLVAAPHIQRVMFRLPDGNMDGTGFPITGYQSLRALYFGSISNINSPDLGSSFTLETLRQALSEIMAARLPERVRTLDYLSEFDCGDHSDHLATAKITASMVGNGAPSASFSGYIGYGISNFPPTMSTSDASFIAKTSAFFAYTPYDSAECQSFSSCLAAGRGESYWLRRQYQTSPALAFASYGGSAQVPVTLPSGTNVARLGQAYSSSENPVSPADAAIDGVIGGYPGNSSAEWESAGEQATAWWGISWDQPYNITSIVLYDRPNVDDWITGCTLTFSDGSTVPVGALANDGSATLVTLPGSVVTSMIVVAITSVGLPSPNIGLSEFKAFGTLCADCTIGNNFGNSSTTTTTSGGTASGYDANANLARLGTARASSWPASQPPQRAIDGIISGYPRNASAEWTTVSQTVGAWLNISWDSYYLVDRITLYDRPNLNDWITGGKVVFDDGTVVPITTLNNAGMATTFDLSTPVNMSSLQFTVTSTGSSSGNVGLAEIIVSYSQPQTPIRKANFTDPQPVAGSGQLPFDTSTDLARNATAKASSSFVGQGPDKAIDGFIGGYTPEGGLGSQEWASYREKVGAWIKLTWPYRITVNQVVLYDRPNLADQITGGTLRFEDGSLIDTGPLQNDGSPTNISVPAITTTTLYYVVDSASSTSSSVGLSEFVVYGSIPPVDNSTLAANSTANFTTIDAGSASLPVPKGINFALSATAWGSTANPNQGGAKAIDGFVNGYKESGLGDYTKEWATNEGIGAFLTLKWTIPIVVSSVVLYDRPNLGDNILAGQLTFSDRSTYTTLALPNNGSAFVVPINNVTTTSLTFLVTNVSPTTGNVGLAEIQVFGSVSAYNSTVFATGSTLLAVPESPNLALNSTAVASSSASGQGASKAINGVVNGYKEDGSGDGYQEWASANQKAGTTIRLTWPGSINVSSVVLYDRPNSNDQITSGTLLFDDGSSYTVGTLPNNGAHFLIPISNVVTKSILFTVTGVSSTTGSVGLSEFEVYGSSLYSIAAPQGSSSLPVPTTPNLALEAVANASTAANGQSASKAIDGFVNGYKENGSGDYSKEWSTISQGSGASITLAWPFKVNVSSVVLYDRPNLSDQITSALLFFDDGSIYPVETIPKDGSAYVIPVDSIATESITLRITGVSSSTGSVGLAEFKVFGSILASTNSTLPPGSSSYPVPTTPNLALNATALASSASNGQGAIKVNDGFINGYKEDGTGDSSREWASANQGVGATIKLTWPGSVNVSSVVLYDRPNGNDQITSGTLRFDDGSIHAVRTLPNNGGHFLIPIGNVVTKSILFTVTGVSSSTGSVGLSEFEVYGTSLYSIVAADPNYSTLPVPTSPNLALDAIATASTSSAGQGAAKANDGFINGYKENYSGDYTKEWASASQGAGATLTLTWPSSINVSSVALYDRPNLSDQITSALLLFPDGSIYSIESLPNNGSALVVPINNIVTKSITLKVTGVSSSTGSVGLAEFQVFGSVLSNSTLPAGSDSLPVPTTLNLAVNATATSSSASGGQGANKANDGIVSGYKENGSGNYLNEWASSGEGVGATLSLTWPAPIIVSDLVFYDRPNLNDHVTAGRVLFSDGSIYTIGSLPNNGSAFVVPVDNVLTESLLFTVTGVSATTGSVGLAELAVYGSVYSNTSALVNSTLTNSTLVNNSTIIGNSTLESNSTLLNNSTLIGNSTLADNSTLIGNSTLLGNSTLTGNFTVADNSTLADSSTYIGNSTLSGNNNSTLLPNSTVETNTTLIDTNSTLPDTNTTSIYPNSTNIDTNSTLFDSNSTLANSTSILNSTSTLLPNSTVPDNSTIWTNGTLAGNTTVLGNSTSDGNATSTETSTALLPTGTIDSNSTLPTNGSLESNGTTSSELPSATDPPTSLNTTEPTSTVSSGNFSASSTSLFPNATVSYSSELPLVTGNSTEYNATSTLEESSMYPSATASTNSSLETANSTSTVEISSSAETASASQSASSVDPTAGVNVTSAIESASASITGSASASAPLETGLANSTVSESLLPTSTSDSSFISSGTTSTVSETPLPTQSLVEPYPLVKLAKVTASSFSDGSSPQGAIDRIMFSEDTSTEWVVDGLSPQWLQIDFEKELPIQSIVLYGRVDTTNTVNSGVLSFSDGTVLMVKNPISPKGSLITLGKGLIASSVRFTTAGTSDTSKSVGLSEVEIYAGELADREPIATLDNVVKLSVTEALAALGIKEEPPITNLAGFAKVAGSSFLKESPPFGAIDDVIGGTDPSSEWAAQGTAPQWIELSWSEKYLIRQVVLFGRADTNNLVTSGVLSFSDGTVLMVNDKISPKGSVVSLGEGLWSSTVRFTTLGTSETSKSVGLSEIQAFEIEPVGQALVATLADVVSATVEEVVAKFKAQAETSGQTTASPVSTPEPSLASSTSASSVPISSTPTSSTQVSSASSTPPTSASLVSSSSPVTTSSQNSTSESLPSSSLSASASQSQTLASSSSASSSFSSQTSSVASSTFQSQSSTISSSLQSSSAFVSSTTSSASQSLSSTKSSSAQSSSVSLSSKASSTSQIPSSVSASSTKASSASSSSQSQVASSTKLSSASVSSKASSTSQIQSSSSLSSVKSSSSSVSSSKATSSSQSSASLSSSKPSSASTSSKPASSSQLQSTSSVKSSSALPSSSAKPSSSSSAKPSSSSSSVIQSSSKTSSAVSSSVISSSSSKMVTSTKASSTSAAPTATGLPKAPLTGATVNIARVAGVVATASSNIPSSPASGVIDGKVGGLSLLGLGKAAEEWVAAGTSPQWVELKWTKQYFMRKIILYGRVNSLNTVTSGVLSFSDGTIIKVSGSILSTGSIVSLGTGIYASSVRFTTAGTSLTSTSVGLSEIEIFNVAPPTVGLIGLIGNVVGGTVGSILNLLGF